MTRPFRFHARHKVNGKTFDYTSEMLHPRSEWVQQPDGANKEAMLWEIWEDVRFDAKLRLYNYITFTKKGIEVPKYKPYAGTEIGKTIPILN